MKGDLSKRRKKPGKGKRRRAALPKGGSDVVMTPDDLALAIVTHFKPWGRCLEPCAGDGAFVQAFQKFGLECDTFEITEGRDFLTATPPTEPYDWLITNEPWSQLTAFLIQGMRFAHNIVFLDKLNAWSIKSRLNAMTLHQYRFREFALVSNPPPPWPQMGMAFAATHLSHAYTVGDLGTPNFSRIAYTPPQKPTKRVLAS